MKFNDKMPTKGLFSVYYSIHPIVDIEGIFLCFKCYVVFELTKWCLTATIGHMAQLGKKNLSMFPTLRKEKVAKAKSAGNTKVPNLQDPLVEVHVHGDRRKRQKYPLSKAEVKM